MGVPKMWAYLVHLGSNMWFDAEATAPQVGEFAPVYRDRLLCEESAWDALMRFLPTQGINTVVIDLGEGVRYESHPELAIPGSWSGEKLRAKLAEIRRLGMTPIPKINFSACHDAWLQSYERMLSTKVYYRVVSDLIAEACELFDHPALFHLGMDEENAPLQAGYGYTVVRGEQLWWHDLKFYFDCVERAGARPWVWSDVYWDTPEAFVRNMPRDVLQSNWYYRSGFRPAADGTFAAKELRAYVELDRLGYEQVPTCSTWGHVTNSVGTVLFGRDHIAPERLAGFMTAPWQFTVEPLRYSLMADAAALAEGRRQAYGV